MALSRTALMAVLMLASRAAAQLAAPNAQGVAMGHIHLNVADPEAQKAFWTNVMGAKA